MELVLAVVEAVRGDGFRVTSRLTTSYLLQDREADPARQGPEAGNETLLGLFSTVAGGPLLEGLTGLPVDLGEGFLATPIRGRDGGLILTRDGQAADDQSTSDQHQERQGQQAPGNARTGIESSCHLLAFTHTRIERPRPLSAILGTDYESFGLIRASFEEDPAMGPAVSRVLLDQVAAGQRGATVRIAKTGRAVAFGRRDCVSPGYEVARRTARELGHPGIERLSGGRATAYGTGVVVLTLTLPDPSPSRATEERFRFTAELTRDALVKLGVDARVGEIPDEYCPGEFSVNAAGKSKLAGIGQRMVKGAAHVGVVVTASGSDDLLSVLWPVYEALGLPLEPSTVGSVEAEIGPVGRDDLIDALAHQLGRRARLSPQELDQPTIERAASLVSGFRSRP